MSTFQFHEESRTITIYLNELFWIESKLKQTNFKGNVLISFKEDEYFDSVKDLQEWSIKYGIKQLDFLQFDYEEFVIYFNEDKTIINLDSENSIVDWVLNSLLPFIHERQNDFFHKKQRIYLFNRPYEKPFLLREKTPIWLSILFALFPLLLSIIALIKK